MTGDFRILGVQILEKEYVPNGEAILVTPGTELVIERKNGQARIITQKPKAVKIYNLNESKDNKP